MPIKTVCLIASIFILFTGCKKETTQSSNNTGPTGQTPTISSIRPNSGTFNMLDTIVGSNFGSKDSGLINGVLAQIISVSPDTLIVKIPQTGASGSVKIVSNGITTSGPDFNYIFTAVVIHSPETESPVMPMDKLHPQNLITLPV